MRRTVERLERVKGSEARALQGIPSTGHGRASKPFMDSVLQSVTVAMCHRPPGAAHQPDKHGLCWS